VRWKDLKTWEDMIAAATALHDGIYSSRSPMPVPKLVGCENPEQSCKALAIAQITALGYQCTKPDYTPLMYAATDCPFRIYDWRDGNEAQRAGYASRAPVVSETTSCDVMAWVRKTLDYLQANNGNPAVRICAGMLLSDSDVTVSLDTLERTGEAMLDRFHFDKPWKK